MAVVRVRYVLVVLCLALAGLQCRAQMSFCFSSSDKNKLNLRFSIIDKDWKYGYVKYNKPMYAVFVKQTQDKLIESYPDHPDLREYKWDEIVNDTVTGMYQFRLQGASFSDIIYIRAKDKKKFRFEGTSVGTIDCECDW